MNRRTFIATTTSIALGTTAATAGCLDSVNSPGTPDVDIDVHTSETFDDMTALGERELTIEEREDNHDRLVVEYTLEPTADECVDVTADITVYDEDDIVIDDSSARDTFDPGDTYGITHTITEHPDDVHRIKIELTVNTMGLMCHT